MQAHSLIPRLTDDQRRLVRAIRSLRDAVDEVVRSLHLSEIDEADFGHRGFCSCGETFTERGTLAAAEADVLEHLART